MKENESTVKNICSFNYGNNKISLDKTNIGFIVRNNEVVINGHGKFHDAFKAFETAKNEILPIEFPDLNGWLEWVLLAKETEPETPKYEFNFFGFTIKIFK